MESSRISHEKSMCLQVLMHFGVVSYLLVKKNKTNLVSRAAPKAPIFTKIQQSNIVMTIVTDAEY